MTLIESHTGLGGSYTIETREYERLAERFVVAVAVEPNGIEPGRVVTERFHYRETALAFHAAALASVRLRFGR